MTRFNCHLQLKHLEFRVTESINFAIKVQKVLPSLICTKFGAFRSAMNYRHFNHWKSNIKKLEMPNFREKVVLKNTIRKQISSNSSTGEFGDGFGPLWDRMLGKLTGQCQTHSCLNLTRRDCWFLVVAGQTRSFLGQLLEDIVNERVHDTHSLRRNSSIWMHLNNRKKPTITPPAGQ